MELVDQMGFKIEGYLCKQTLNAVLSLLNLKTNLILFLSYLNAEMLLYWEMKSQCKKVQSRILM